MAIPSKAHLKGPTKVTTTAPKPKLKQCFEMPTSKDATVCCWKTTPWTTSTSHRCMPTAMSLQ